MKRWGIKTISITFIIVVLISILCSCQDHSSDDIYTDSNGKKYDLVTGEFSLSDYSDKLDSGIQWKLSEEKIETPQNAVDAARKVLDDPYAKQQIFTKKTSWEVRYDRSEEVWLIRKHHDTTSAIIIDTNGNLLTSTFD